MTMLVVNTAAQLAGALLQINARSGLLFFLIPTKAPAALNPFGVVTLPLSTVKFCLDCSMTVFTFLSLILIVRWKSLI